MQNATRLIVVETTGNSRCGCVDVDIDPVDIERAYPPDGAGRGL